MSRSKRMGCRCGGSVRPLLARCLELRDNLTVYVALAELLEVALLTADARLAPGPRCRVELLG